ncbi:uncharacterized protein LOC121038989 isoform X3 [Herpailurus yagouaroundi]|uniref:uncharacterized protein LOC121038989 isoform X3 n=1 Tax=Herpailurus yagouaroundi TaxID=1608482 RepID=UPI001AD70E8A|nr:uncharacterized protein LOC121038989 isoform X3 [Puma yagouaroundi]
MGGRSLRARDKTSAARAEVDGESGGGIFPDTPPSPLFSAPAESHQWRLPEQGGGVESRPGSPTASSSAGGKPIVLNWPRVPSKKSRDGTWGPHSRKPLVPGETRPDRVLVVKCLVDGLSLGPGCPPPPQPVLLLLSCPQWACWRAAPGASSSPARDQLTPHTLPGGRRGPHTHLSPSCHAARESSSRLSHGPHPGAPG